MRAIKPEDMKKADLYAINTLGIPAYDLMGRAAREIFTRVWNKNANFVILCGKGNNGGDGYALGKLILEAGGKATIADVFGCEPSSGEAKAFRREYEETSGKIYVGLDKTVSLFEDADVIVDAVFGTGFSGDISSESELGRIILAANAKNCLKIAVDAPSGVNALDGTTSEVTFRADVTYTLAMAKPGLYGYPAKSFCGGIEVCDIGIPESVYDMFPKEYEIADESYPLSLLRPRGFNTHKGSFGRLLAVVGSENMPGAAALCAKGALRSGVGLLNIASDRATLSTLKIKLDEPIYTDISEVFKVMPAASAMLVGCGMGRSPERDELVFSIAESFEKQLVFDADGINAISSNINVLKKTHLPPVLTPHPLEFSRLTGIPLPEISKNRIECAKRFAAESRSVVVLKGAGTVVSDGVRTFINTSGNSGLSKGGSGDVLAGVIGALCAEGYEAFEAACIGVYVHGLAADRLAEKYSEYGLLPSELPCEIGKILGGK